jgi:hypothetical protein
VTIKELRARIEALRAAMRTLNDAIGDGEPTDEQSRSWQAAETELGERTRELDEALSADTDDARAERAAAVQASRARWRSLQTGVPQQDLLAADARSAMGLPGREATQRATALLDDDDLCGHLDERQKVYFSRLVRQNNRDCRGQVIARLALMTSTEAYRNAWGKALSGREWAMTSEERDAMAAVEEYRTHMSLTDANGGYAVPVIVDPTIMLTSQGSPNDILRLCRIETITNDVWKGLSSAGATWAYKAEGAEFGDISPAVGSPSITTRMAGGIVIY